MEGVYYDPKHGGCLRVITRLTPTVYHIDGVFGDDERGTDAHWHARARVTDAASSLLVDFAGKPGKEPRFLRATHCASERRIRWEDGNAWVKLYAHPTQFARALAHGTRRRA